MSDRKRIFLYGTLCDPALLAVVAGSHLPVRPARLPDRQVVWARGESFPLILERPGHCAEGLVIEPSSAEVARLDFYETGFGYRLENVEIASDAGEVPALVYVTDDQRWEPSGPWSLPEWQDRFGDLSRSAAADYMALFERKTPFEAAAIWPQVRMRAASRLRAEAEPTPDLIEPSMRAADVALYRSSQPFVGYFAVREDELSFPRFSGDWSGRVKRETFMGGDAVTVLPYDPERDSVLIIRQFRHGAYVRGDPNPWCVEPVAGRIDAGETPEETAHREVAEETGLRLRRLHEVARYYPTPGAYSEYLVSFVAIADLDGADGHVSGVAEESEDIMSHVMPFDALMHLVERGGANTGPLLISAFWLAAERDRLRRVD